MDGSGRRVGWENREKNNVHILFDVNGLDTMLKEALKAVASDTPITDFNYYFTRMFDSQQRIITNPVDKSRGFIIFVVAH